MTTRIIQVTQRSKTPLLRLVLLSGVSLIVPFFAASGHGTQEPEEPHSGHEGAPSSRLVEIVRRATRRFADVNAATYAGYRPFLGCVSGPDHGAMGIHYVNNSLVGDREIDASLPQALIYEPQGSRLRLVGVEFIVDAVTWLANHDGPPVLEGQSFQLVNSPNRYALPAFFELHVWAWRENPNGAFVDWNNRVSCEGQ